MRHCTKCGHQMADDMLFCQKCGTKVKIEPTQEPTSPQHDVLDISEISDPIKTKKSNKQGVRTVGIVVLVFFLIIMFIVGGTKGCTTTSSDNVEQSSQSTVKSGEDYESLVWDAFWEGASDYFGVEYSSYKMWDTVYDWIQDFETSDGYTSHYYLIRTAFETTNVLGQKITHQVTARCYYVPDYSDTVYLAYMTLNGETVFFDEEKEDWLMGMGEAKAEPASTNKESVQSTNENDTQVAENKSTTKENASKPNESNTNTAESKPNKSNNNTTESKQSQSNTINTNTQHTCSYGDWEYYSQDQHQRYCTSCYEVENTNHSWDNGNISKQPTCSAEGEKVYACTACGGTRNESISKLAHNFTEEIDSNKYLKSKATYTSGAEYYYSCVCGQAGTEYFSLNNRMEWITTDMLREDFNLSAGWIGENELRLWTNMTGIGEQGDSYLIYDQMRNGMGDSIYNGTYNGVTIRFYVIKHSSQYAFNYDDLVAAGII